MEWKYKYRFFVVFPYCYISIALTSQWEIKNNSAHMLEDNYISFLKLTTSNVRFWR